MAEVSVGRLQQNIASSTGVGELDDKCLFGLLAYWLVISNMLREWAAFRTEYGPLSY